jgi:glutathione S-transferase
MNRPTASVVEPQRRLAPLEKSPGDKHCLLGDKFTAADAYLFAMPNRGSPLKITEDRGLDEVGIAGFLRGG